MLGLNVKELFDQPLESQTRGCLLFQSSNTTIDLSKSTPTPQNLWNGMWFEGELCCLFADSNLGKSILAVQISEEIAKSIPVIYADFELSDKQFELRYTDGEHTHKFPPHHYRVTIDQQALMGNESDILRDLEDLAFCTGVNTIIIDNLTWLANDNENGQCAGELMKKLMALKFRHGWSIMVIAHTPKRPLNSPLVADSLAGSKKLFNFFDSVFAIGRSAKDENLRYIKQIKCRYGEFRYGSDNVIVAQIVKDQAFTHFEFLGCATEQEHLIQATDKDREQTHSEVLRLHNEGYSLRDIATKVGMSKSSVANIIKKGGTLCK